MLSLYSIHEKKKVPFRPISPDKVTMYVCGPTVYDRIHLGNGRAIVVFDLLYRLLCHLSTCASHDLTHDRGQSFKEVIYVRNITDVDDKINAAAKERGISIQQLTEETTRAFHHDIQVLGALPPTYEPCATHFIPEMIIMIQQLIHKGHAYEHQHHVLFSVTDFQGYGSLSNASLEQMRAGARVDIAPYKKNPMDFVLWKPASPEEVGFDSPWGRGRPGWHIECSAMSCHYFGPLFDIHGGGSDLLFPHHENEQAQSCAISGQKACANYWLHNGMLLVDGQKMSKSLGNFITVEQALDMYPGEVIRWALLSTHYRQTLDWTSSVVHQAQSALEHIYQALQKANDPLDLGDPDQVFLGALKEDMNTPEALKVLQSMASALHKDPTQRDLALALRNSGRLMGLLQSSCEEWFRSTKGLVLSEASIEALIQQRHEARKACDYKKADAIRLHLLESGVALEDVRADKTLWRSLTALPTNK